jgi:hypothetical protein
MPKRVPNRERGEIAETRSVTDGHNWTRTSDPYDVNVVL